MGKYINLRPIAKFERSIVPYIESNFRAIAAALQSLTATDVGAALTAHTHPVTVENFILLTLVNSWANIGGAYAVAAYYKDPFGRVHLKGTISGGATNTTAGTLPTGYRPLTTQFFTGNGTELDIVNDGRVVPRGGVGVSHSLNVSFRAEQ